MFISSMLPVFAYGVLLSCTHFCESAKSAWGARWYTQEVELYEIDRGEHLLRSRPARQSINLTKLTGKPVRIRPADGSHVTLDGELRDDLLPHDVYVRSGAAVSYALRGNGDVIAVWSGDSTLVRRARGVEGRSTFVDLSRGASEDYGVRKEAPRKAAGPTGRAGDNAHTCRDLEPVKLFEIAVAFDSDLCALFGGGAQDVVAAIYSLVSIANAPFRQSTCIKMVISHIDGYCDRSKDPYVAFRKYQNDTSSEILFAIEAFWKKHRQDVHRDAMLLMNGYLHKHYWGQAFVGATCELGGYGWVERLRRASTAHELGHMLGCTHQEEGVMQRGASIELGTRMQFSKASIDEIVEYVDNSAYAQCVTYERDVATSHEPVPKPSESVMSSVSPSMTVEASASTSASHTPTHSQKANQTPTTRAFLHTPTKTAVKTVPQKPTGPPGITASQSVKPVSSKRPPASRSASATSSMQPSSTHVIKTRTKRCSQGLTRSIALDCKKSSENLRIPTKLVPVNVKISQKFGRFVTRLRTGKDERGVRNGTDGVTTITTLWALTGYKLGVFGSPRDASWPHLGGWKQATGSGGEQRKRTLFVVTRPSQVVVDQRSWATCCGKRVMFYIAVTVSRTTTTMFERMPNNTKTVVETDKAMKLFGLTVRCVDCANRTVVPGNVATAQMCPKCI